MVSKRMPRERDAVVGEHVRVVLEMVADLAARRILEHRLQRREHALAVQLLGRAGIVVAQRHVGRDAGLDAEGDADDLGLHVVEAGGLGVEGEQRRRARSRASQRSRSRPRA